MATFPSINPSYSVTEIPSFNTKIIGYGNQIEQRIAINSIANKIYRLQWNILTPAEKDTLYNFFVARLGSYDSFTWTNVIDSVSHTVRFKEDSANFEYFNYLLWRLQTVEFREVIS